MFKNKLNNYFIAEILRSYAFVLASLSFLIWITQSARFLYLITDMGLSMNVYVPYILYQLPKIVSQMMLISFLISLFISIIKFQNNKEMEIYWLSGISKKTIIWTILKISLVPTFVAFFLYIYLAPMTGLISRNILANSEFTFVNALVKKNNFNSPFDNLTVYVGQNDNRGNLEKVYLFENNQTIIAKRGKVLNVNDKNYLQLIDGFIHEKNKIQKSNCGTCSQCIDICPTKAFVAPYKLDANKCISYLTIEHKTHIPREFRALIGNRIYGCDDCLAVCPWNKYAKISNNMSFIPREDLKKPSLESLSLLSDEGFRKYFSGSPIKRIGRNQFIRNVLIAMGNSSNKSLVKNIINLLGDNSSIVRLSAVWALGQLCKNSFFLEMNKRVKEEKEQEVINEWRETEKEINHCGTYG